MNVPYQVNFGVDIYDSNAESHAAQHQLNTRECIQFSRDDTTTHYVKPLHTTYEENWRLTDTTYQALLLGLSPCESDLQSPKKENMSCQRICTN